jgi:hypothetical protein
VSEKRSKAGDVELLGPQGVALDPTDGTLFVVDWEGLKVLFLRPSGQVGVLPIIVTKKARRWKERRVLVEVAKHDVMLDFAWKELLHVCLQLDPSRSTWG